MDITKEDAVWLVEVFNKKRGGMVSGSTIGMFLRAINTILNQERKAPSCSCEYKTVAAIANNVYQQYENEILKVYNS